MVCGCGVVDRLTVSCGVWMCSDGDASRTLSAEPFRGESAGAVAAVCGAPRGGGGQLPAARRRNLFLAR